MSAFTHQLVRGWGSFPAVCSAGEGATRNGSLAEAVVWFGF
jgi:hypothetical protein